MEDMFQRKLQTLLFHLVYKTRLESTLSSESSVDINWILNWHQTLISTLGFELTSDLDLDFNFHTWKNGTLTWLLTLTLTWHQTLTWRQTLTWLWALTRIWPLTSVNFIGLEINIAKKFAKFLHLSWDLSHGSWEVSKKV